MAHKLHSSWYINVFTTAFAVSHLVTLTILYSHVGINGSWAFTVNCSGLMQIFLGGGFGL